MFTPDPSRNFNRGATDYFVNGRQDDIGAFDTPKHAGLALGHVTHEQSADPTMPFGSRFIHNLARMTWSAKREPDEGHVVRLVNRKANDEAIAPPFLVELTWGERVELRLMG